MIASFRNILNWFMCPTEQRPRRLSRSMERACRKQGFVWLAAEDQSYDFLSDRGEGPTGNRESQQSAYATRLRRLSCALPEQR